MNFGVFAYQAGVAEALVPLIEHLRRKGRIVEVFSGASAKRTFDSAGLASTLLENPKPMIRRLQSFQTVLTGTSWEPEFEAAIWNACRLAGVRSVAFVDNWMNYAGRFETREGRFATMPDAVAVVDEEMRKSFAGLGCPTRFLHVVGHPALERIASRVPGTEPSLRVRMGCDEREFIVVWAADGIYHGSPKEYPQPEEIGYCDEELLENSIAALNLLAGERRVRLVLRRHPASPDESLPRRLREKAEFAWDIGDEWPKWPLIEACDVVAGGGAMLLLEAAISGKPVVSCLGRMVENIPLLRSNRGLVMTADSVAEILDRLRSASRASTPPTERFSGGRSIQKLEALLEA